MKLDTSSFENTDSNITFEDIQELMSNGATSVSYKVRIFGKWHFLKRPKPEFADNPLYLAAFDREFDLGYTLDHPNIVRYISKGYDSDGAYLLTEYVDGVTLSDYIGRNPDFCKNRRELNRVVNQICDALGYLHSHNIVHYDLKPDNILITRNGGNVKLVDLGFSYSDCYEALSCGSKQFSAPEQFENTKDCGAHSDIYALGRVVEFMFSGHPIPVKYKKLIRKSVRSSPEKRFKNIDEFRSALNSSRYAYWWVLIVVFASVVATLIYVSQKDRSEPIVEPSIVLSNTVETDATVPSNETETQAHLVIDEVSTIKRQSDVKPAISGGVDLETLLEEFRSRIRPIIKTGYAPFFEKYSEITDATVTDFRNEYSKIQNENADKIRPIHQSYSSGNDELSLLLNKVWTEEDEIQYAEGAKIYNRYIVKKGIVSQFKREIETVYINLFGAYGDTVRDYKNKDAYEKGIRAVDSLIKIAFPLRDSLLTVYSDKLPDDYGDMLRKAAQDVMDYQLTRHYVAIERYNRYCKED